MRGFDYRDFMDDLSTLLRSGVPVREALENMATGRPSRRTELAGRLHELVRDGASLGEALAAEGRPVSPIDVGLVEAGEAAGRLVEILDSIVRRLDARRAFRDELLKRSLYGLCMLVLACVLLPLYLVVTGDTSTYVLIQACVFLPLLLLGWVASRGPALFPELSPAREPYEKLLLGTPILGSLLARLAFARAFEALGLLVRSGVSYREGIPLAAASIRWNTLRRSFLEVHSRLESGESIADGLGAIEPYLRADLRWRERVITGDTAGKVDHAFLEIAHEWDERFQESLQHALRVLPVVLILLVGLIVAMRFLAVFEGIHSVR